MRGILRIISLEFEGMKDKLWLLAGSSKREGGEIIPSKVGMEVLGPGERLELHSIQGRYKEKVKVKYWVFGIMDLSLEPSSV